MSKPVLLGGGDLSVVLCPTADRYRHDILSGTGETSPVLASLEGADNQAWPPSPPFQELHVHEHGGALLLVGRAGRGHWSASVEIDRSQQAIVFDVACRSSGPIDWLGSSYECPLGDAVAMAGERRMLLSPSNLEVHVLEGEPHLRAHGQTRVLSIVPTWAVSSASQTVRWRYRIRRA